MVLIKELINYFATKHVKAGLKFSYYLLQLTLFTNLHVFLFQINKKNTWKSC